MNESSSLSAEINSDCVAKGKGSGLQLRERRFDPYHSLYAFVAQMVERGSEEPGVVSSILTGGTISAWSDRSWALHLQASASL